MQISTYCCPQCGAQLVDHYDPEDLWGWFEEDGERFRCEGKLTGEYYAPFVDENGITRNIPRRTKSCGWFRLEELILDGAQEQRNAP